MELLIALFLIIVVGTRAGADKAKSANAKRKWEQSQKEYKAWEEAHCDRELEKTLELYINDPSNKPLIEEELAPIISALSSDGSLFTDKFMKGHNRELDLLLANRGKVSHWAAVFGYDIGYGACGGTKEQCFEFADVLKKLLAYRGVELDLIRKSKPGGTYYYWVGSSGSSVDYDSKITPFTREAIFAKTTVPIVKFP